MFSDQQLNHFRTFGFVRLRQLLDSKEMERITELTNRTLAAEPARPDVYPGHVHVAPFMEKVPELALLPEDERFYAAAEQLRGAGFVWGGSEANRGSFNATNSHSWHCDRIGQIHLNYTRLKIMIYL